ncbi:cobalamin-dependent protein [bacterium]|nr:cobalamin-dependent protein [bacterium]
MGTFSDSSEETLLVERLDELTMTIEQALINLEEPGIRSFTRDRFSLREYVGNTIASLAEAIATGQPDPYSRQMGWMRSYLRGLGIQSSAAQRVGNTIQDTLKQSLSPSEVKVIQSSFTAGTEVFSTTHWEQSSFLEDDAPHVDVARDYLAALLRARGNEARQVVLDAADRGLTLPEIYLNVLEPVQYEIGRLWEIGKVGVADEHYASGITHLVMAQLYLRFVSLEPKKRTVVCAATDDQHELGIRMVADLFEYDGWTAVFLGARTPVEDVISAVQRYEADLLAVSATLYTSILRIRDMLKRLKASEHASIPVIAGGFIFRQNPSILKDLGIVGSPRNAEEAVKLGNQLVKE